MWMDAHPIKTTRPRVGRHRRPQICARCCIRIRLHWRLTPHRVKPFNFTALPESYSGRTSVGHGLKNKKVHPGQYHPPLQPRPPEATCHQGNMGGISSGAKRRRPPFRDCLLRRTLPPPWLPPSKPLPSKLHPSRLPPSFEAFVASSPGAAPFEAPSTQMPSRTTDQGQTKTKRHEQPI